jgi:hypothetical protein
VFAVFVYLITVGLSMPIWGILRTGLWILPTLLLPELGPIISGSLLSFWTLGSLMAPYANGAFDFRDFGKLKFLFLCLGSAIIASSLLNPDSLSVFFYCFIFPPLILLIFYLLRQPANYVLFFHQRWRWILVSLWLVCAALRIFENHSVIPVEP